MTNWANPVLTTPYAGVLTNLKDRDFDVGAMFNPDFVTATNIAPGVVRWNPLTAIWEIRNAAAGWDPLAVKFNIDVDTLDGQHGSFYQAWGNLTGVPASFTPSVHNHDALYYTKGLSDGAYGNTLIASGNNTLLKAPDGTLLSTLQVPYATTAGDAATVAGFTVDQNLMASSSVLVNSISASNVYARGAMYIGRNGWGGSEAYFFDDAANLYRSLEWNLAANDWQIEAANGVMYDLFYGGRLPNWTEVVGKPVAFTPSPHGHVFDATNQMQVRREVPLINDALTGLAGELVFDTTALRLYVHDGVLLGGEQIAYVSDIPNPQSLTNYARKDQAETFASTLNVTGKLTVAAQAQMVSGRIVDASVAATTKNMLSVEGDASGLQLINFSAGSYEWRNSAQNNGIRFFDGIAGVSIVYNGQTRLQALNSGVNITGTLLINGQTVWDASNDGPLSGLDADLLDGNHATGFVRSDVTTVLSSQLDSARIQMHGTLDTMWALTPRTADNINWDYASQFIWNVSTRTWQFETALKVQGGTVWHNLNDGGGSGLDADLLDGQHASAFQPISAVLTATTASFLTADQVKLDGIEAGIATTFFPVDRIKLDGLSNTFFPIDRTKFDAIEAGATADQTPAQLLTAIKTVDGPGSGLDADLLDGYSHSAFNGVVARYTTNALSTSRLKIRLPWNTNSTRMLKFTISQYSTFIQHTYEVSGYLYSTTNQWLTPRAVYSGTGTSNIIVGRDPDGRAYVSLGNGNYTGLTIHSVTMGYTGTVVDSYNQGWSIALDSTTPNSVPIEVHKVWTDKNDGTSSGLDADKLRGFLPSDLSAINTMARRDSSGDINTRLFRSEYDVTNSNIGFIMTQVNTGTNNYIRPSTPAQLRAGLGIEAGATADQTPAQLLTAIKTVDGPGSGLDADLLDGWSKTTYQNRANHTGTQAISTITGTGTAALHNTGVAVGDVVQVQTGGKLPALDGSNLTGIQIIPTVGAVGSYAFLGRSSTAYTIAVGGVYAGSTLRYTGGMSVPVGSGIIRSPTQSGTPPGTWRAMGYGGPAGTGSGAYRTTLMLRIA